MQPCPPLAYKENWSFWSYADGIAVLALKGVPYDILICQSDVPANKLKSDRHDFDRLTGRGKIFIYRYTINL